MVTIPRGVIPALITPVSQRGEPDLDAVGRLVRHAMAGGVHGLAPCGSTGEGWRLDARARAAVVSRVVEVGDGLPVIAGVPVGTRTETLTEIDAGARAGVGAALIAPPPGLPLTTDEIADMYLSLAASASLPLVIYHIPSVTHAAITPELVGALCDTPGIAAVKDSSRDLETLQALIRATAQVEDFTVLTGADTLLVASLAAGAHGTIAASPGLFPELAVSTNAAFRAGQLDEAVGHQRRLAEVVQACRAMSFPLGWKAAAAALGLAEPHGIWPAGPTDTRELDDLRDRLTELGVLPDEGGRER